MARISQAKYKRLTKARQWVEPTPEEAIRVTDWEGAIWWLNHLKDEEERLSKWFREYLNDGGWTEIEASRRGNHVFKQIVRAMNENHHQYDFCIRCITHIIEERDKQNLTNSIAI